MSDTSAADTNGAANGAGDGAQPQAPQIRVLGQYIKDLSFENPNAPGGFSNQSPQINVAVDVRVPGQKDSDYEVELRLTADAKVDGNQVFLVELVYGAVFRLENIPEQGLQPVLLIECPRILFPFARRVIADMTRDGGFPPLMIDPIDFAALYRQRLEQAQAEKQAAEESGAPASDA
ncbi:protein-export chaperone SecB [Pyruvatibacter sp.]|uniref:protein-export chaperone SecB n=1 Tax=unclassified Pyruvatibacter TaxID=2618840 RepID=UPI002969F5D9|nr:protein-export chaperone SecB [Alphaproteobacteria bacterium]